MFYVFYVVIMCVSRFYSQCLFSFSIFAMCTFTHVDDSRGVGLLATFVCLSVFPHDISKIDAARITKHDTEMSHDEFWKTIYFGVKMSKVKVTSHKKHCWRCFLHFFE